MLSSKSKTIATNAVGFLFYGKYLAPHSSHRACCPSAQLCSLSPPRRFLASVRALCSLVDSKIPVVKRGKKERCEAIGRAGDRKTILSLYCAYTEVRFTPREILRLWRGCSPNAGIFKASQDILISSPNWESLTYIQDYLCTYSTRRMSHLPKRSG